jgi:hypothetical protein
MSNNKKLLSGCIAAFWSICITTPMWLVLLYHILTKIQAAPTYWALFWCYVPAVIIGGIIVGIFQSQGDSK